MAEQNAAKIEGNGMLHKIILAIAGALCVLLIGMLQTAQHEQVGINRDTAEKLGRLEAKVDILLRSTERQ